MPLFLTLVFLFLAPAAFAQSGSAAYVPAATLIQLPKMSLSCSVLAQRILYREVRSGEKSELIQRILHAKKANSSDFKNLMRMASRRQAQDQISWQTQLPFKVEWKFESEAGKSIDSVIATSGGLVQLRKRVQAGYFDWEITGEELPDELDLKWNSAESTLSLSFTMPLTDYCFGLKGASVEIGEKDHAVIAVEAGFNQAN